MFSLTSLLALLVFALLIGVGLFLVIRSVLRRSASESRPSPRSPEQ